VVDAPAAGSTAVQPVCSSDKAELAEPPLPIAPAADETREVEPVVPLRLPVPPRAAPTPKVSRGASPQHQAPPRVGGASLPIQSQHVRLQI
jgi:hypothetical protein